MDALTGRELIDQFVAEALESLREVPRLLETFQQDPSQTEAIHAAFRAVHSMKGTAACLGLDAYKLFVHGLENVLAQIRDGKTPLSDALLELLIEGIDHLEGMLRSAAEGAVLQQLGPAEHAWLARVPHPPSASAAASSDSAVSSPPETVQAVLDEMFRSAQPEAAIPVPLPASDLPSEASLCPASSSLATTPLLESAEEGSHSVARPSSEPSPASPTRYVRVKEVYLDEFLEDVSHLFITGELLRELEGRIPEAALGRGLAEEFHRVCQDLRLQLDALHRSAASLRRISAGELFAPYPRMARSLAVQLKKKVRVRLLGEEVEIDRALARELEAPLTHLVRNAVDHGIESPQERRARGADEIGVLLLKAERNRHWVRISVEDDGRGIAPDRLRQKAVEKGVLTPQQAEKLSRDEAIQLIFHPGLSTAEKVSDVSGRGVGMDVVRTVAEKYRGRVDVESSPGIGTKIHLTIPIREAVLVLDGLLIRCQEQLLVLPLEHVREILQLCSGGIHWVQNQPMLQFRNRCYPLVGVPEALGYIPGQPQGRDSTPAALVGPPGEEICLQFDELLGHRQVVVRTLEGILPGCTKIQGVALLGGGRLALVLNVPEILTAYRNSSTYPAVE